MLDCIPWHTSGVFRGRRRKQRQFPASTLLEQLPLCAECRSRGVLAVLKGAPLPRSAETISVKKSSVSQYLRFPSLATAGEQQASCIVCRFVLGMIPAAERRGFDRWPCDKGYDLWFDSESVPDSRRFGSFKDTSITLHASLRLGLPMISTGSYIRLVEVQKPRIAGTPSRQHQAIIEAKMRGQIHFDHIRMFLKVCEAEHPECHRDWPNPSHKVASSTSRSWQLRLIDVSRGCLVSSTLSARYVALSYVWGGVDQFYSTRSTLPKLMEKDGLFKYWSEMPRTITDSIQLVKSINERYLWVDCLCILQDDPGDKAVQIARMDRIFSAAVLTVCAIAGHDAHAGLPGVFPATRPRACYPLSPTAALVAEPGRSEEHIRESEYESRGWTLQERALARRCLYVMEARILVSCRRWYANEHEEDIKWIHDRDKEEREDKIGLLHAMTEFSPLYPLNRSIRWGYNILIETACAYNRLVELYTKRQLTFRNDIVDGFTGIASRMEEFVPGRSLCAMPSGLLHFCLLWTMANDDHVCDEKPKLERNENFPSWAWAGYLGHITYANANALLDLLAWDEKYTLRMEYELKTSFPEYERLPQSPLSTRTSQKETKPQECSLPSASPSISSSISSYPTSRILHLHAQVIDTWHFAYSEFTCPEPERVGQPWRWYFYSQGVAWRANIHKKGELSEIGPLCGMLLDAPANLEILKNTADACDGLNYGRFSFVLLSRTHTPDKDDLRRHSYLNVSRPESEGGDGWVNPRLELHAEALKWIDKDRHDRHKAEILSVLVVGWKSDGYAERVGIAYISAEAWQSASPIRKCVRIV